MARQLLAVLAVSLCSEVAAAMPKLLPLQRVRLYETGVGYFERQGRIEKGTGVSLPVPATHLDDALMTLVVMDAEGRSQVSGIEFSSRISRSMGRALAGLPADEETSLDFPTLLQSLKGAQVEVRLKAETLRGRLVDVLSPAQSALEDCVTAGVVTGKSNEITGPACIQRRQATVLILTNDLQARRLTTADITSVRPLETGAKARLDAALDALSRGNAQVARELSVTATGGSAVRLGYVAETPVWRATYRFVLDNKDRAELQGWALIHNDTDESWKAVNVELVNGRPDSFLFPLAAPRYARRELVTPDNELSTVPQLLDRPADELWATGDMTGDTVGESYGTHGMGLSGVGFGGGGRSEGIGFGSIGTLGHGAGESRELSVGSLSAINQATGVEFGALFRYAIKAPIDLRSHGSALVPFVAQSIKARRIAWFAAPNTPARMALHVTNQTQQTLPPGTVTVFVDGGFAGQAVLTRLRPAQSQLLYHGADLDVELNRRVATFEDSTQLLTVENSNLVEHFRRRHRIVEELTNKSGESRTVYRQLKFVNNARVEGADELSYDTDARAALAIFKVGPRQARSIELKVEEALRRDFAIDKLSVSQLRLLAAAPQLNAKQRTVLIRAIALIDKTNAVRQQAANTRANIGRMKSEIQQIRDDLTALRTRDSDTAEALGKRLLETQKERRESTVILQGLLAQTDAFESQARAEIKRVSGR
jgi:hypothetical protein